MPSTSRVLRATVTPLASILGSGLLIIVPVMERTLGALAVVGVAAVSALAWVVGSSVRHCVRVVEPALEDGTFGRFDVRLDRVGDAVIAVAYIISVALYLRIMAEYVIGYLDVSDPMPWRRILACASVVLIVCIGITRGFDGLDRLDRFSLVAVLVLTTALGVALLVHDLRDVLDGGMRLPPVANVGVTQTLLVLGGVMITVQGFETVRYLGDQYDAETRVRASRLAQLVQRPSTWASCWWRPPCSASARRPVRTTPCWT